MANVYHSELADTSLHYPKGASTASSDTWLMANGDGTTTFTALPDYTVAAVDQLESYSSAAQELTTNGQEAQVVFGASDTSPAGSITMGADGTVTFNEDGLYNISLAKNAGRTTSAGVNQIAFSIRLNDSQVRDTTVVSLDSSDSTATIDTGVTGVASVTAGDELSYHMLYLTGTSGNVGLYPLTVGTTGWDDIPAAAVTITKLGVA